MRCFWFFLLVVVFVIPAEAAHYRPELSGSYERGEKSFLDPEEVDSGAELLDHYYYHKCWLKYRQQLAVSDYYYLKIQYVEQEYLTKDNYDRRGIDLSLNYTFKLREDLRNRYLLTLRNQDYKRADSNDYQLLRLKYQLDYYDNPASHYVFYCQRQWKEYPRQSTKNNIYDRLSLGWKYKVNPELQLNTTLKLDRELFDQRSLSSNKFGKSLSVGFKLKL